jgi:serine protease
MQLFNSSGTYQAAWQPTITTAPSSLTIGQTYPISGTQFNGVTTGAEYGDDYQANTNYPLVRIVNNTTSHVFYARTHGHSTMGVATGSTPVSTNFDVPVMETGACQLYVVANGIPSAPSACTVGQPTGIYSPVNGTPLTSTTVTFSWGGTGSATAYWLDVGKEQGGNEYEQSGSQSTSTLSLAVSSLPTDGSAVWARLYSLISGTWQYSDYSYKALGGPASLGSINTPTPSTTLTKTSQAFTWSGGTGATAYELTAGSSPFGTQYYSSGNLGNVVTATAGNLPSNGSTIYVTLYSLVGTTWYSNQYNYTALTGSAGIATMTTPVGGTVLAGGTVSFTWAADANATAYGLNIGSTPGGNNYFNSGSISSRTLTESVKNLPVNGTPVYATLISVAGGVLYTNSYTYTAAGGNSGLATLQTPTAGSALCSTSTTFTWNAPVQGTPYAYWVDIGTSPGTNNVYQSGSIPVATTSITVGGVPLGGNPLYATLYTEVSSTPVVWQHNSYNFIEASLDVVNTPANSSVLGSPQQSFGWTNNNPSCTMTYELDISAIAPGGNDVWQSGDALSGFSVTNPAGNPMPASSNIYTTLYTVNNGTVLGNTQNAYTTNSSGIKGSIVKINGGKR